MGKNKGRFESNGKEGKFKNGKFDHGKFDRSSKAITREAERSQKLKKQLEKRETWFQCQCPHSMDMLRRIETKDPSERLYQCKCGKVVRLNRLEENEVEKSFKVMDQICDNLKTAAKPGTDDEILNHLSQMQFNIYGLQKTYYDWTNKSQKDRNRKNRDNNEVGGFMNTDPKKKLF